MSYTHGHAESVLRTHRWRDAANSAAYLLSRLDQGMSLLDVGCGPGTITIDLARRLAPGRVVGIDAEASVLEEARRTAADAGGANLEFQEADAYRLPYDDSTFDVVHAHQVLHHLEDPVRAVAEMARVCRPDGTVALRESDYGAFTWYPDEPAIDRWLDLFRAVARANGGEPDAGRRLKSWVHEAGLGEVVASGSVWCFSDEEQRTWWAESWAQRTESSRLGERAVELGLATAADLAEIAAGWRRWASHEEGWFLVPHAEVLCTV